MQVGVAGGLCKGGRKTAFTFLTDYFLKPVMADIFGGDPRELVMNGR
jgi:hypothetical protein